MIEARISRCREATLAMVDGRFDLRVPEIPPDEVGRLGAALNLLATTLERRFEELHRLVGITTKVNTGLMLNEVLNHVYEAFHGFLPFDRIGCALIEAGGRTARAVWARAEYTATALPVGYAAPLEGSSLQAIIDAGTPRIISDLEAHLREHPQSDSTRRILTEGIRASLTCPLLAMGKPVGFLFFSSCTPGAYDHNHGGLFQQIAGQLAVILEKARLYEQLLDARRQLEAANRVLDRLASLDGLTGLPNRRYLDEHGEVEIRRMQRMQRPLALLLMDIDHFKAYNDTYGHLEGDECLKLLAHTIRDSLQRATDFIARFGGEEFAVILTDMDEAAALRTAEMLRTQVEALDLAHNAAPHWGKITISIGLVALVPEPGMNLARLLDLADAALYRSKREGRNRVTVATLPADG